MKMFFIPFLVIFLLAGCNRDNVINPLTEFKPEIMLKSYPFHLNTKLGFPGLITNSPDYLILQDMSLYDNSFFIIIDKNNGHVVNNFGKKGKGPNEILTPISLDFLQKNKVGTYDASNRNYLIYSLDSMLYNSQLHSVQKVDVYLQTPSQQDQFMKVVSISDSLFIGNWSHSNGRYCIFDKRKNIKQLLSPEFPYDTKHKEETRYVKSFAYQYNLKICPDKTKMCAASTTCGHFELFNINGDSTLKYFDKLFYHPLYEKIPSDKMIGAIFQKESLPGFQYLDVTDNYIYLSFLSNKNDIFHQVAVNDYILKFDWEGNAITKYKVDRKIGYFTVDEKNQKIYATSLDTSSLEPNLIYFNLVDNE